MTTTPPQTGSTITTLKKVSIVIAGTVFSTLSFGLKAAHAHGGHVTSSSPDPHTNSSSSVDYWSDTDFIDYGETVPFFNGLASSWVSLDKNKNPSSIGIKFTESALFDLPTTSSDFSSSDTTGLLDNEYLFSFPEVGSVTAFNHIGLNWNPQGHDPDPIYGLPHFDIHFYTISPEERQQITVTGDDIARVYKTPSPELIAPDYGLIPGVGGVPTEGWHATDATSPEFMGQPFDNTFIYGYYNGEQVFWEPMITKAFLDTYPNDTRDIKLPAAYSENAYYPTSYSVKYDETSKEYTVSLDGLTYRSAKSTSVPESSSIFGLLTLGAFGAGLILKRNQCDRKSTLALKNKAEFYHFTSKSHLFNT